MDGTCFGAFHRSIYYLLDTFRGEIGQQALDMDLKGKIVQILLDFQEGRNTEELAFKAEDTVVNYGTYTETRFLSFQCSHSKIRAEIFLRTRDYYLSDESDTMESYYEIRLREDGECEEDYGRFPPFGQIGSLFSENASLDVCEFNPNWVLY